MIKNSTQKRLVSNFISLMVLQGANYILPLMTLPYLVRVLGAEYFGLLAFATAMVTYFNLITEFGFNISATKEIAINRDNKEKLNEIFSSVMTIKILLFIFSFIIFSFIILLFDKFNDNILVYYLTFGLIGGQVLFPVWFFQGMENMKYITYLNILSKAFFTVCIFIFVHVQQDYWIVPLLTSLGYIFSGVISIYIVINKFHINYKFPSLQSLKVYTKESSYFFISNIAGSLYTTSITVILGFFSNNTIVGYYSAADKIIQAFKGLINPFTQTIYPYISKKVSVSKEDGLKLIRKIALYVVIIMGLISLCIFTFSKELVYIILGNNYKESIEILQLLAPLPFLVALGNIFGLQTMIPFGHQKAFSSIIVFGGLFSLCISFILVPTYHQLGSAVSLICTELCIAFTMFMYLQSHDIKIIGK